MREGRRDYDVANQQSPRDTGEEASANALLQSVESVANSVDKPESITHIEPKELQLLLENYKWPDRGDEDVNERNAKQHATTSHHADELANPQMIVRSPLSEVSETTSSMSEAGEIKSSHGHGRRSIVHAASRQSEEDFGNQRSYVEEDSDIKVMNWRIRGRFLEYQVVLFGDTPKDSVTYWDPGDDIAQAGHLHHIHHFFKTHQLELEKLKRLVRYSEGPDAVITSNALPKVYGSQGVVDLTGMEFFVGDTESKIGEPIASVLATDLDYAMWREAIAQHWRNQKLRYNLWQIEDTQEDRRIGGRTVVDISKNVLFYEE